MEEKKIEITKLQEQEKALYAGFQSALGENNKFANFLMKVLKKKIKRAKKKEVEGDAGLCSSLPPSFRFFSLTLKREVPGFSGLVPFSPTTSQAM